MKDLFREDILIVPEVYQLYLSIGKKVMRFLVEHHQSNVLWF